MKQYQYQLVATGGTFDRLHKGHETLLCRAFEVGERVIIGVTTDEMVKREKKILKEVVMPYEKRVGEVRRYLKANSLIGREIIAPLTDVYGPTVLDTNVAAIVCTRETRSGAIAINRKRKSLGREKLAIIECKFISSSDRQHISSTRIRLGQIDRKGLIFGRILVNKKLPQNLRNSLKQPIDILYSNVSELVKTYPKPVILIAVGDVVYNSFERENIKMGISIIDLKSRRKKLKINKNRSFDYAVNNKAGTVSKKLLAIIRRSVKQYLSNKKPVIIKVIGEEDLAVIPAIIASPLETVIVYGQPSINGREGLVGVRVTEEKKQWAVELLGKFK